MEKGTIKRLTDKGFGFIATEDNGKDMFFHSSACEGVAYNDLHEGQTVTYTVGQGPKGPRAAPPGQRWSKRGHRGGGGECRGVQHRGGRIERGECREG